MAKTLATRMAFGEEIIEIAKTNENFVVCNADTKTCGLEKFGKLFPNREFSFGIAEQNLVGASAGLAACGNKVFLATFAVFASVSTAQGPIHLETGRRSRASRLTGSNTAKRFSAQGQRSPTAMRSRSTAGWSRSFAFPSSRRKSARRFR